MRACDLPVLMTLMLTSLAWPLLAGTVLLRQQAGWMRPTGPSAASAGVHMLMA